MADLVEFHPLLVAIRPARVAVRMGQHVGWEHSALRVLEALSVTWGGGRDIIVASGDEGTSHEQLWAAVELYDPDVWASHVQTYRGHRLRDPDGYDDLVDREAKKFADTAGSDIDQARSQIDDLFMSHGPMNSWEPPAAFWNRSRERLAPYWDREYGYPEMLSDDELPTGLLVDVTQLAPLPDRVLVPQTDGLPLAARVLIASRWGAFSPAGRARLEERGVVLQDIPIAESDLPRVVGACWGSLLWAGTELRRAVADALGQAAQDEEPSLDIIAELDHHGPFALSMLGLSDFTRPLPLRNDWPLVVSVGDTADDFALAVSLDRCMAPALWVPPDILGSDTVRTLADALQFSHTRRDRDRDVHVTSCSLDDARLAAVADELNERLSNDSPRVSVSLPVPLPTHRPLTTLDTRRSGTLEDEIFVGDTTGRGIRAQLPTGVEPDGPLHPLSWWVDVARVDHQLPTRWPLNEHLVARSSSWKSRARVTRDGIAFCSHGQGFIAAGQRLEQIVDSPRLRFPGAKTVFEVLAAEAGLSLAESAAGRYASQTMSLWGGLPRLIEDLHRPVVRLLLDAFLSTARSGEQPGNRILERRYLSRDDLALVTGGSADLTEVLDRFLRARILRRGLCLGCQHCSHFGWYDTSDVTQSFVCWRCRAETIVDSTVVKSGGPEPIWYYALAEVVHQAHSHNFSVPVLALHQVSEKARSVLGMAEHRVQFPPGEAVTDADEVEIDLWGIIDGRIVLGEAKSSNQLESSRAKRKKKAQRLRRAADALTADTLVLATAQDAWAPSAVEAIDQAFDGARCTVDIRTSVDPHLAGS